MIVFQFVLMFVLGCFFVFSSFHSGQFWFYTGFISLHESKHNKSNLSVADFSAGRKGLPNVVFYVSLVLKPHFSLLYIVYIQKRGLLLSLKITFLENNSHITEYQRYKNV